MKRGTWLDTFARAEGGAPSLSPTFRDALARLDDALFAIWDLGDNVLLAWTHDDGALHFLAVRHYAIAEAVHSGRAHPGQKNDANGFVNEILAGSKYLAPDRFREVCREFGTDPQVLRVDFRVGTDVEIELINELVRRYSVSLVRGRAVVLLDAVEFSLQPPLDQMAMLNSLSFSVNSAYRQLLSKEIDVNFARTTTGDGFYIWNRATNPGANVELYKLMMLILADNAVAQRKARSEWVPKLRAAFHVGEHYEFHQVEGLNPTTFSYIVGQVTVDLARMIEKSLPGQILLGDSKSGKKSRPEGSFVTTPWTSSREPLRRSTTSTDSRFPAATSRTSAATSPARASGAAATRSIAITSATSTAPPVSFITPRSTSIAKTPNRFFSASSATTCGHSPPPGWKR